MEPGACDAASASDLQTIVIAATLLSALLVARWLLTDGGRHSGVGLQLAYLGSFWMNHWVGAAANALPWYCGPSQQFTALGARESLWGLAAFAGVSILCSILRRAPAAGKSTATGSQGNIPRTVFYWGITCYILSIPLGRIPSLGALLSVGQSLILAGICLLLFQAWEADKPGAALKWWLAALALPVFTVVSRGFIGYGIAALLAVLCFAVYNMSTLRLRRMLVASPLILYIGLSVFVTYMRDRNEVRAKVWGGAATSSRIEQMFNTFTNFELISPTNDEHLNTIDGRLNQNALVGAAVSYTGHSTQRANGETIINAFFALIPRAIWPNKPAVGGSGDLVSRFTGMTFAEGTSVGIGQVLEFYVNFGTPMVVIGFGLFALILSLLDFNARLFLNRGDYLAFAGQYVLGMSFQQLGGSLTEVFASAAASWVLIVVLRTFLRRRLALHGQVPVLPPDPLAVK